MKMHLISLMLGTAACGLAQPALNGTPANLAVLRYIDIAPGVGAPAAAGKRLTVHYTGWLKDGTKFDSSVDRNEPFQFVQGRKQVITGWDVGFEGMKVGGKRRLFIPYQFAYGEQGTGPIPAKAELIFDVELLGVTDTPTVQPAIDILLPLADLETRVMQLAKSVPEAKYAAVAGMFSRIVNLNKWYLEGAQKDSPEVAAPGADPDLKSKEDAVAQLETSFAELRKELEAARNGYLGSDATLLGKTTTRRGLFAALDAAIAEQLGRAEATAAQ